MNKFTAALTLLLGSVASVNSSAGEVEVAWTNPENYTDARAPFAVLQDEPEDTFYNLEQHLARLSKKLPADYLLKLDVKDLDLAGEALQQNFRVVRDRFPPRIEFSYQLVDSAGKVLKQGDENIRDLAFLTNRPGRYQNEIYAYEKQMLDRWFKNTFAEHTSKH